MHRQQGEWTSHISEAGAEPANKRAGMHGCACAHTGADCACTETVVSLCIILRQEQDLHNQVGNCR